MYLKIENSGVCERKGMVRIRYSFFLDENDHNYETHYLEMPIIPPEGYPGEVDETGSPIDIDDYNSWLALLPTEWVNNPFHNHFTYEEPTITDQELIDKGEAICKDVYKQWKKDEKPDYKNNKITFPERIPERITECDVKVIDIKSKELKKDKIKENNSLAKEARSV